MIVRCVTGEHRSATCLATLVALLIVAMAAPSLADVAPVVSRGWAGYVAGGRGHLKFQDVSASWRQPTPVCTSGNPGSAGIWVGLGGFRPTSRMVEQIGTDLSCGPSGRVISGAWYELVPKPAHRIGLRVSPGDLIRASVQVAHGEARLTLADVSRHETFDRVIAVPAADVSSADWIVEAPSGCAGQGNCAQLPLADFGTARIADASASTRGGVTGSTVSSSWITTKILMLPDPIPYDPNGTGYAAIPGTPGDGGSVFAVKWLSSGFRYLGRMAGAASPWQLEPGGVLRPVATGSSHPTSPRERSSSSTAALG